MSINMPHFSIYQEDRGRFYLSYTDSQPSTVVISQSFSNRASLEQYLGYLRETALIAQLTQQQEFPRYSLKHDRALWQFELLDHLQHTILTSVPFFDEHHCLQALEDFKRHAGTAKIDDLT